MTKDGRRWTRPERLADLTARYELPRPSVADCVLRLVDVGYEEELAATVMLDAYENAVLQQRAYHEPWIAQTSEIIVAIQEESTV